MREEERVGGKWEKEKERGRVCFRGREREGEWERRRDRVRECDSE